MDMGKHESHPETAKRLKRAEGHLRTVIAMIEGGRPCVDIAQQLHAVEQAVARAKKSLIGDHIAHCLDDAVAQGGAAARAASGELKILAKYL